MKDFLDSVAFPVSGFEYVLTNTSNGQSTLVAEGNKLVLDADVVDKMFDAWSDRCGAA